MMGILLSEIVRMLEGERIWREICKEDFVGYNDWWEVERWGIGKSLGWF